MNTAQDFLTEIGTVQKQLGTLLTMLKPNLDEFIRQECMKAFNADDATLTSKVYVDHN